MSKNYLNDWREGREIDEPVVKPIPKKVILPEPIPERIKTDYARKRNQKERDRWLELD